MKKEIIMLTTAATLFFVAQPAFAIPQTSHKNVNVSSISPKKVSLPVKVNKVKINKSNNTTPSAAPNVGCDPSLQWKNHGAYVSCVAHLHQGGKTVSNAARSNVGKKVTPTPPVSAPVTSVMASLDRRKLFSPLKNAKASLSRFLSFSKK